MAEAAVLTYELERSCTPSCAADLRTCRDCVGSNPAPSVRV